VISDYDSDILLETIEKADIFECLDDDCSTLAGFEEELVGTYTSM
jgi:hypothetical protein